MKIFTTIAEIQQEIAALHSKSHTVGFVPTMGALHRGHISLIERSLKENTITVASIFVNPTQFNNREDLDKYPRTVKEDIKMLEDAGCQLLFLPTEQEMYPQTDTRQFDFNGLDTVMEGKFRPGHFNGVAQIVSKLLDAVDCHHLYLGEKDFQQVAILQFMLRVYYPRMKTLIVPCAIVREPDGLAMSSRNMRLTAEERKSATAISQTLFETVKLTSQKSVSDLIQWAIEKINTVPHLKVEYFEIVNDTTLLPVKEWNEPCGKVGCIAVFCGNIRLIDNIRFN